jgi:hypothetical protein
VRGMFISLDSSTHNESNHSIFPVTGPRQYLRVAALFLLAVSIIFLILTAFFMFIVTVEGAILQSL